MNSSNHYIVDIADTRNDPAVRVNTDGSDGSKSLDDDDSDDDDLLQEEDPHEKWDIFDDYQKFVDRENRLKERKRKQAEKERKRV